MKLLQKLTAIIILLSMLITLNSPIISYAANQGTDGEIGNNYEIMEEETWDISKNGDGSVTAKWTLDNQTITISGSGKMKDWGSDSADWHNTKYQNIIEKIEIKSGITEITNRAFSGCSRLKNISISNTVTKISANAFNDCNSLENINVEENNNTYISIDGILFNEDKTKILLYPPKNVIKNYTIPSSVVSFEEGAFRRCSNLTNITIPNSVTSIAYAAFSGCSSLESINIPNSVISIGSRAFSGCSSLTSIDIPSSVTSIENNAFSECSNLTSINIPEGVTSIGNYAFSGCSSLTSISIPKGLTSIGNSVFYECNNLTSINIPEGVTSIGDYAFSNCNSLTSIDIPSSVTSIGNDAFSGCSSLTSISIIEGLTSIGNYAFYECSNLTSINIPEGVTSIGDYVFSGCGSLTSIEIPSRVTSIGDYAFEECKSLTNITIPSGVTSIGAYAFSGCKSLINITIPSNVTSIGGRAFSGCSSLESINIPNSVTSIESSAFSGCSSLESINVEENNFNYASIDGVLYNNDKTEMICYPGGKQNTSFLIPNSVTSIKGYSFTSNNCLEEITIPDSVTSIENINSKVIVNCNTNSKAHEYCENNKIYYILLDDNTSNISTDYEIKKNETWDISQNGDKSVIAKWTLDNRTITISGNGEMKQWIYGSQEDWHNSGYINLVETVEIKSGVKSIGNRAFENFKSLSSINIPNSVTSIRNNAFTNCKSLTSINIPREVSYIYLDFHGCTNLTEINVPDNHLYCKSIDGVLYSKDKTEIIIYPEGKQNKSFTIPNSVTSIHESAFYGCSSLKSIEIPNSVTSIGSFAFSGCSSLESINIPNSVKEMYSGAFYKCTSLKSINIPNSIMSIEKLTFQECKSLTNIIIPSNVTSIEDGAFEGCSSLTNITIPSKVSRIGKSAFSGCSSLKSINIPNRVTSIEDETFSGCSSLTNITIPNSVTSIGQDTFEYCKSLKNITIPGNVTNIGSGAFARCSSLTSINIPNSVKSIGDSVFSGCSNMTNTTIPSSVTSIGGRAFSGCSSLTNITIPSSVTSIGDSTFYKCSSLTNITIPSSVTSIGSDAFSECSSLTNITIPSSVTSIGDSTFYKCSSLTSINIPNSVTNIGRSAFGECRGLRDIIIPDSVTSIGEYVFYVTYGMNGTIACKRNTEAHRYAESKKIGYILDEKMPKVTYTPSEFEKAQKQIVVKIDVTDITGVEEDNIKYLWSTKEEVTKAEVNNKLTNGQEVSSPTGKTGTYYIYVYAKDKFGNEGIAKSSPIKLDNTAPTIELAENKYYQKPNIQDENLETVGLTKDGNKVETYKYGETIFGEGTYEITATDEAGNSTTKEFVLQKIPTGEEGLNYEITPSELTNQDVTLNVSKKDATNTELEIELSTDGKNYEVGNTKTITENGKVYARLGKEGAYGEAIEIEITNIDKKAPVIEGVKNKRTYANKATPKAVDENLESVKLKKEGQEVVGYENGTTITELGTYKITAIDKVGNKTEVEFYIKDIPSTEEVVEYTVTPEGLTNQDVKVSVTKKENEEYQDLIVQMSTDGKNYEAVAEKTITENGTVYIRIVKEEEGNTIEGEVIEVEIKNIDKTEPEAQVAYSNKELTKENVTVTITANEEIQEVEGWTRGEDRKTLTKEYSENKTEEITVKDLAGNSTKLIIEITNIDKTAPEGQVTYSETNPTNKNVIATITANEEIQEVEGWTISQDKKKLTKEYNENKTEKVIIRDKIGNEKEVDVKVLNIDRTKPEVRVTYSTKNKTNKNVTVTITVNEEIQGITGWTLSSDKKKLTKEYSANKTETITIKDLAGNTSNVAIEITNIDKTAPEAQVAYSNKELTKENVTVTITANEEIQGITGWTLSNNKKTLTKIYQNNVEETIQVKDLAGNTADKNISIRNIDKTKPEIAGVENANSYNDSVIITVTDTNPGTLLLEKDGEKVEGYTNGKEIIEEGTYKLTAVDKLGNTTIVNFTIKYVRGDLNKDSKIDMQDVLTILKHISQEKKTSVANKHPEWKLSEKGKIVSDTDRNGKVEMLDVLKVLQYIAAKTKERTAQKHPEWLNLN